MPDRSRYRRVLLIGLLAISLAVAGAVSIRASRQHGRDVRAASSSAPPGASSIDAHGVPLNPAAAVSDLLRAHGDAVLNRSTASWLATIDPRSRAYRTTQTAIFRRILMLKPVSWAYTFGSAQAVSAQQASTVPGAWIAQVTLTYRLTDGGTQVTRRQYLLMAPASPASPATPAGQGAGLGPWRIVNDDAGSTQADLWDLNPITVVREQRCLVVSATTWTRLSQRVASVCDRSARRVDSVWGTTWSRSTVLVIPATQKQLGTLLDRSDQGGSGLENTAAVTIGPASSAAEEVLVNPAVFKEFPLLGIRVVLTHELTHVATRGSGAIDAPTWLAEGFADYVGFGDSGLSPHEIAGDALDQVQRGTLPRSFPADADFDAASKGADAAYGYAWALVRTIALHGGTPAVVRFYREAATPDGSTSTTPPSPSTTGGTASTAPATAAAQQRTRLDAAIRDVLGMDSEAELITAWQRELRSLA